jgi:thiamine biosynthesis lipoprotein
MNVRSLTVLAAALLSSCVDRAAPAFEYRILAMGTWVDLVIADEEVADGLVTEIEGLLRELERDYYAWGDGELAALNRALSAGEPFDASPGLAALLDSAQRLSLASGGAFEPGIGPLVALWGFDDGANPATEPPDPAAVSALTESLVRIGDVSIDGHRVRAPAAPVTLDLGGIAKGEAVDRVIRLLAEHGVANALVDAGGDLRVIGAPPNRSWRIGVRAPRGPDLIGVVELAPGEAAFTSGDYERYFEHDGTRAHHLLDPATGRPVTHTQAVTVIAADGVTADAAATALFVAGAQAWPAAAEALGVADVLRIDASGRIEATPSMRDRLQINAGRPRQRPASPTA